MKYIFAVYFFLLVFVANAQMQTERQYYYRYQIAYENRIIILDDDFLAFFNDIYEIIPSDLRVHITEVQLPPDVNVIDNGISTTDTTTTWSDLFNHFPRIQQVVVTINGNPPIVIPAPGTPSSNTPYLFNSRNSTLTVELSNIGEVPAYIGALTNSIVIADTQDSFVQYLSTHNNILDLFTFLPNLVFLQMPNIIEIPATDNVNIFGQSATNPNTSLTTIVAAKLTIIGASTFANCIVLRNLSLPQARKIGSNAFSNDVNLSPTNRFGNLQIVGEDAFSNTPLATVYPANETVEYSISIGNFSNGSISFIATSLSGDADKTNEYSEVKFTITPAQHYYLQTLDVTIAGLSYTAYSPALTLTFQQYTIPASDVSGDIIIAATFEKVDYTCTFAQTENGTIAVDYGGIIVSGDNVQYNTNDLVLTLSPNSHYQFQSINVNIAGMDFADYSQNGNVYTIPKASITGNVLITATFAKVDYTCTFEQTDNGTIAVDYGGIIVSGDNVQYNTNDLVLTLSPNSHYQFQSINVNIAGTDFADYSQNGNVYTIPKASITGDVAIAATFEKVDYTVSVTFSGATGLTSINNEDATGDHTYTIPAGNIGEGDFIFKAIDFISGSGSYAISSATVEIANSPSYGTATAVSPMSLVDNMYIYTIAHSDLTDEQIAIHIVYDQLYRIMPIVDGADGAISIVNTTADGLHIHDNLQYIRNGYNVKFTVSEVANFGLDGGTSKYGYTNQYGDATAATYAADHWETASINSTTNELYIFAKYMRTHCAITAASNHFNIDIDSYNVPINAGFSFTISPEDGYAMEEIKLSYTGGVNFLTPTVAVPMGENLVNVDGSDVTDDISIIATTTRIYSVSVSNDFDASKGTFEFIGNYTGDHNTILYPHLPLSVDVVSFNATPNPGMDVSNIYYTYANDVTPNMFVGTPQILKSMLTDNIIIHVEFSQAQYKIYYETDGNGSLAVSSHNSPASGGIINNSEDLVFTITPNAGYRGYINSVEYIPSPLPPLSPSIPLSLLFPTIDWVISEQTYTLAKEAITDTISIAVSFALIPYSLVYTDAPIPNGTLEVLISGETPEQNQPIYTYNNNFSFTITPNANYELDLANSIITMGGAAIADITVTGGTYGIPNILGSMVLQPVFRKAIWNITVDGSNEEYIRTDGDWSLVITPPANMTTSVVFTPADIGIFDETNNTITIANAAITAQDADISVTITYTAVGGNTNKIVVASSQANLATYLTSEAGDNIGSITEIEFQYAISNTELNILNTLPTSTWTSLNALTINQTDISGWDYEEITIIWTENIDLPIAQTFFPNTLFIFPNMKTLKLGYSGNLSGAWGAVALWKTYNDDTNFNLYLGSAEINTNVTPNNSDNKTWCVNGDECITFTNPIQPY